MNAIKASNRNLEHNENIESVILLLTILYIGTLLFSYFPLPIYNPYWTSMIFLWFLLLLPNVYHDLSYRMIESKSWNFICMYLWIYRSIYILKGSLMKTCAYTSSAHLNMFFDAYLFLKMYLLNFRCMHIYIYIFHTKLISILKNFYYFTLYSDTTCLA